MISPAARLFGFVILLVVMLAAAYVVGARLGPLAPAHGQQTQSGTMDMGSGSHR